MKTSKKVWLIVAVGLVVGGAILAVAALVTINFDFNALTTVSHTPQTYTTAEAFDSITVRTDTDDIWFAPSADDTCRVEYFESPRVFYTFAVQDRTLLITREDERRWYDHIGIVFDDTPITVYLPQSTYASVTVDADTSDITLPTDFCFSRVSLKTDTGDITCSADATGTLDLRSDTGTIAVDQITAGEVILQTATGDIAVTSATVADAVRVDTDTGDVELTNVRCTAYKAHSSTGDIALCETVVSGDILIESNTGDVTFVGADAADITVKTSTGDVTGTLLSEKVFITETATGDVAVPSSADGGICKITTSTGDVKIDIV